MPNDDDYTDVVIQVQAKHPALTQFGFGGSGDIRPEAVKLCVEWLLKHDAFDRRKTINEHTSSYSWKHIVERYYDSYIAEGEFICAALYLGYKMKKRNTASGRISPNAWFNIREYDKTSSK